MQPEKKDPTNSRLDFVVEQNSVSGVDIPVETRELTAALHRQLHVQWLEPALLRGAPETTIEIRGRMFVQMADGRTKVPIDWVQPVRVLLARRPQMHPDWSQHIDRRDSAWGDGVIGLIGVPGLRGAAPSRDGRIHLATRAQGEFSVRVPAAELKRSPGKGSSFQIGLSLGTKTGHTLMWDNSTPVLSKSLGSIELEGPAPLNPGLQLINGCPSPDGRDYDPLALVRAVNHLQSLGKPKAVELLRHYVKIANVDGQWIRDPMNIDTSDQQSLYLLIPMLFDHSAPGHKSLRSIWISSLPLVRIEAGLPFHIQLFDAWIGPRRGTSFLVNWAAQHGELRGEPIRPTDDPLAAADALADRLTAKNLTNGDLRSESIDLRAHLRFQAWRMIAHLIEPKRTGFHSEDPELFRSEKQAAEHADLFRNEKRWEEVKVRASRLKIRWDEKRQEYISGSRDKSKLGERQARE
jgi:hypothetical protein